MKEPLVFVIMLCSFLPVKAQILKKPIEDKTVVLTFDDAPASQYSVVAPLLQQYGFDATFFVCEFPPNYKDSSLYMNWRQIRELDQMGFEIASHTRSHARVASLTKPQLIKELTYIETKCDSLGIAKPANFAYPGYSLSPLVVNTLDEQGYAFARAGGGRPYDPLKDHPLLVPSWAMDSTNRDEIMQALNEAKDGKIAVLTIHGVPDVEHPWVTTPPELFEEYLKYLSENGYKVLSMKGLERYIDVEKAKKTLTPDYNLRLKN
ncbi:MAG: polysaccharide deacetylase family protein [Imperialibacter sp.]|uniref:polysaccharide deacetylase family protein n=1 Tax=Imperialibacter sp. TaxID=2038411 RepID=UPI0032EC905D